jgi:hypothetical protein
VPGGTLPAWEWKVLPPLHRGLTAAAGPSQTLIVVWPPVAARAGAAENPEAAASAQRNSEVRGRITRSV